MKQITIAQSRKIARAVLAFYNSGIDPRSVNMNDQIDLHLSDIGPRWKLKESTFIDGLDCQFIGALAHTIRANAVEE